tara:strand:+ start:27650 stop:27967 length:318 start_codon:yes stop_codon:yes gene_type:complete
MSRTKKYIKPRNIKRVKSKKYKHRKKLHKKSGSRELNLNIPPEINHALNTMDNKDKYAALTLIRMKNNQTVKPTIKENHPIGLHLIHNIPRALNEYNIGLQNKRK